MGKDVSESIKNTKIPILVLDQKWHQLFRISTKTEEIKEKEKQLNDLLKRQGQLNGDLKQHKKLKSTLMNNIVENMDGTEAHNQNSISSKKLEEDKRLIDEINQKIEKLEDELLEIPRKIKETNEELMVLTVTFCYDAFRTNAKEVEEITNWITQVRHDLKVNIVKKQNRELHSKQMYAYMHDIFGAQTVDLFDLKEEENKQNES
jgi:hypothetical protein